MSEKLLLAMALALSVAGASFKSIAWLSGSMAALVDALTCFASIAAGMVALWTYTRSMKPPDAEHSYGHERYLLYGSVVIVVIYSVVLGIVIDRLVQRASNPHYRVEEVAPLYIVIGTAFYALAVLVAKKGGSVGRTYAAFISSEIIEGVATIGSAAGGAFLSSLIDYVGGWCLTAYLAFEILHELRKYERMITDWAEPNIAAAIEKMMREKGLEVRNLRLRMIIPGRYVGDAIIVVPRGYGIDEAHRVVDEVVEEIRRRLGVELVVHYEPEERGGPS